MKRIIVLIGLSFMFANVSGQYKVNDKIYIDKGRFGGERIYIQASSENKFTNIDVSLKKIDKIHSILFEIKNKLSYWQEIAERDSIEYVNKEFKSEYNFYASVNWSNGAEWWSNSGILIIPYFKVENGKGWLNFRLSQTISASVNRYIRLKDFSWNFYSVEEIDAFIEATQQGNIKKALEKGVSDHNLFK